MKLWTISGSLLDCTEVVKAWYDSVAVEQVFRKHYSDEFSLILPSNFIQNYNLNNDKITIHPTITWFHDLLASKDLLKEAINILKVYRSELDIGKRVPQVIECDAHMQKKYNRILSVKYQIILSDLELLKKVLSTRDIKELERLENIDILQNLNPVFDCIML